MSKKRKRNESRGEADRVYQAERERRGNRIEEEQKGEDLPKKN
jgi:hypothetical protein